MQNFKKICNYIIVWIGLLLSSKVMGLWQMLEGRFLQYFFGYITKKRKFLLSLQTIVKLIIILAIIPAHSVHAKDDNKLDWMNANLQDGSLNNTLGGCIPVPKLDDFMHEGSASLNLAQPDVWVATGQYVKKDKAINFEWNASSAVAVTPRKYKVLYRIDPRFDRPQLFIKTFNSKTNQYEANAFPKFNTTDPSKDYGSLAFNKMKDYVQYFALAKDRKKIPVEKGDIINITLTTLTDFFGVNTKEDILKAELDPDLLALPMLYTNSNIENKIVYSSAETVCNIIDPKQQNVCQSPDLKETVLHIENSMALIGQPLPSYLIESWNNKIASCPEGQNGKDNQSLCFYDQGRGMRILLNNQVIKRESESFVYSGAEKYFLYYKAENGGNLDFITQWPISTGMFVSTPSTLMQDWVANFSKKSDLEKAFTSNDLKVRYLHFGRYIMNVEIGKGEGGKLDLAQQKDIGVEYYIVEGNSLAPENSRQGVQVEQSSTVDANESGYLWLRVKNPNPEVSGMIKVHYRAYGGTSWFSDIIYNKAVKPITDQFHTLTKQFYTKLTDNSSWQKTARVALVVYVAIYGLTFIIGTAQITAKDLVIRAVKISLIVVLLGKDSWEFFNVHFFSAFTDGVDYIMSNVIGTTSSKSNIFGFIDPLFEKYTNGNFWFLIFIELLQIHNGLTFIAIMTLYSLTLYFRAILEVIVSYIIAYIGLSVMISLAPFFIILCLFEQTKSIFDSWISTLFSYVMQPSILLIFFLLIDQLMSQQLSKVVVKACWDPGFIPIEIGLDLRHLDIPLNFSFKIPFLPGIPFFASEIIELNSVEALMRSPGTFLSVFSSALLFYSFCLMAYGIVEYVSIVVAQLTNVTPARQEGDYQKPSNPTSLIVSDITGVGAPIKDLALAPGRIIKDKLIDQNYRARPGGTPPAQPKQYANKIFASRHDGNNQETGDTE